MVTAVRVSAAAATEHFVRATVFLIFFFFSFLIWERQLQVWQEFHFLPKGFLSDEKNILYISC